MPISNKRSTLTDEQIRNRNEANKRWYNNNKELVAVRQRATKYNISEDRVRELLKTTNCDICNAPLCKIKHKYIDHCHKTGMVRGVLCHTCNCGLGHFKDDIDLLNKAKKYLKQGRDDKSDIFRSTRRYTRMVAEWIIRIGLLLIDNII